MVKQNLKKLNPREGYLAPYIQLPWGYREDLIGRAVEIYECDGGFYLKYDDSEFKLAAPDDISARLSKLEVEVSDLKNLVKKKYTPDQIRTGVAGSKVPADGKHGLFISQIAMDENSSVLFTYEDLELFVRKRTNGLTRVSIQPIRQISGYIWENLKGKIDQHSLQQLSDFYINRYTSHSARHKCFIYTRLFLMHLYKSRMDVRLLSYHALFEEPKNRKVQKVLTTRVIIDEDIHSLILGIKSDKKLPLSKKDNYMALILFLVYSGQRVVTASRLRKKQVIEALSSDPPILTVESDFS